MPHSELVSFAYVTHESPSQQPEGHEEALQTHWPLKVLQAWPAAHGAHAAPPVPHSELDSLASGTHVLPSQQPERHEEALQTHWPVVVLHVWPDAHATHAAPPEPHAMADSLESGTHVEPLLQPEHEGCVSLDTSAMTTSFFTTASGPTSWATSGGGEPSETGHPLHGP